MSFVLPYNASPNVTVPANARIACYSDSRYTVTQVLSFANYPSEERVLFSGVGAYTSSTFTNGANLIITGGDMRIFYSVGTAAVIVERQGTFQAAPVALNSTGTLTAAAMLSGIVTSTAGALVTATLDTGTVMDAANSFQINDAFIWSAINTGGNNFVVTASSGHTVEGSGTVAGGTSGRFLTRKTAANTFVTYRI